MNKKIDVIVKYFYPVAAGIETNVLETYRILVEKGWDVTIHTSNDTLTQKAILPNDELVKNIKVKRYSFGLLGYWPKIDWDNTSVVCLHNFNIVPHIGIILFSLIKKVLGKKLFALVLTPHGGFNPEWSVFPRRVALAKQFFQYNPLTISLINNVIDKVRGVSDWESREIISKGITADKVITISNGIEDEAYLDIERLTSDAFKEKVEKLGRYLIQIGRVYPIKNYETVIRALPSVPNDIKFVIVGPIQEDERYQNFLKALIHELNLDNRVIFWGVARGIEKYYLIKKAKAMVHMAIWESFCNVVHEGMSQGLICLVANNTALPFLIKNGVNGYCIETHDHESLSAKINFVLDRKNSSEISLIKKTAKKFGLETSWRKVADKMDKLYKSLIQI